MKARTQGMWLADAAKTRSCRDNRDDYRLKMSHAATELSAIHTALSTLINGEIAFVIDHQCLRKSGIRWLLETGRPSLVITIILTGA